MCAHWGAVRSSFRFGVRYGLCVHIGARYALVSDLGCGTVCRVQTGARYALVSDLGCGTVCRVQTGARYALV